MKFLPSALERRLRQERSKPKLSPGPDPGSIGHFDSVWIPVGFILGLAKPDPWARDDIRENPMVRDAPLALLTMRCKFYYQPHSSR